MICTAEEIREKYKKGEIYMYHNNYAVPQSYERDVYGQWKIRCKVEAYPSAKMVWLRPEDLREREIPNF